MFVPSFLVLVVTALASASAIPSKVIPVFEDVSGLRQPADHWAVHRTLCHDDCHHHILHKPVFVVRSLPGAHTLHFAPGGLNGLGKSPLTMPLNEAILTSESSVIAVIPFARFPWELFPGLLDSEVIIPEHATKLSSFYKEAPVVAIFTEEEFKKINERRGLIQVADFDAAPTGFTVIKEHALINRNAALGLSPEVAPTPVTTLRDATPVHTAFAAPAKTVIYPITGGLPQYAGGAGEGEPLKYFSYVPVGSTYIPDHIARG